jgi:hypothetical protein
MGRAAVRRSRVVAGIGLAVALLAPSVAQGAVTTGSQGNWPDAAFDVNAQAYNPSVERLDVAYDNTAGKVTATITLDRAPIRGQYFYVNFALAKPQSGQSCGDSRYVTPLAYFGGYVSPGFESGASVWFDANSGYTGGEQGGSAVFRSARQYEFSVTSTQALVRQELRCVTSVSAYGGNQYYEAGNFCLGACPQMVKPPQQQQVVLPPAPTRTRGSVDGQAVTLNWDASTDPNFSYFAIRRGTQPDTNSGTWTRLPGNYTSPTVTDSPGPGTYYYYVTQINTRGAVSARSATVRVVVPSPAPPVITPPIVSPPPPVTITGPTTQPVTTPVIVSQQGQTPVVAAPPSTPSQRTVSALQAVRQAKVALRLVHGKAFREAKRLKVSCRRVTSTRRSCKVSWTYKRYRYRGTVVVRIGSAGYSTTVSVKRARLR